MLLTEVWNLYEADKKLLGYSPHTLKAYKIQHKLMLDYFEDIDIIALTTERLKTYLVERGSHLKPSSLGHRIRFIKSLFRWAQDEGFVSNNPSAKIKEPKSGKRIPKALSEEDIELLREGCKSTLEHALIEFTYSTGCRVGEIVNVNRADVNWETRSVTVLGKGDKEREVYFTIKCSIWLRRYLRERSDSDPALFVTERAPHRMSLAQLRYVMKRVARNAGVGTNVYPHKLRHSYATHLLNNGAPLEAIQTLLGHEKLETTKLYAQLSGPIRREIYQRFFR